MTNKYWTSIVKRFKRPNSVEASPAAVSAYEKLAMANIAAVLGEAAATSAVMKDTHEKLGVMGDIIEKLGALIATIDNLDHRVRRIENN